MLYCIRVLIDRNKRPNFMDGDAERLFQNFQAINSLQSARMKLWELKQWGGVQKYIEEFRDLQVSIVDMSAAEALDVFKQGLKEKIRKEKERVKVKTKERKRKEESKNEGKKQGRKKENAGPGMFFPFLLFLRHWVLFFDPFL